MIIESEGEDRGEGGRWVGGRVGERRSLNEIRLENTLFGDDRKFGELIWMR
jgi:hypothetical protein